MNIILVEFVKFSILLGMVAYLLNITFKRKANQYNGWGFIVVGFSLLLFGSIITLINQYSQHSELFQNLEPNLKSIGDFLGLALLATGLFRWLPSVLNSKNINNNTFDKSASIQQIIDLLPNLIIVKDQSGKVLFTNKALPNVSETRSETLASENEKAPGIQQATQKLSDIELAVLSSGKQKFIPQEEMIGPNGNIRFFQSMKIPFKQFGSEKSAILSISTDITKRKRFDNQCTTLNKKLSAMQEMNAHDELTTGIHHDFNSALSGIMLAARLLKKPERNLDARGLEFVELIISTSQRAVDLSNKLSAQTKKTAVQPKLIDIVGIVRKAVTLLDEALDRPIKIYVDNKTKKATVVGNSATLLNIFVNLGLNTTHSISDSGEISFTISTTQLDQAFCDVSPYDIKPGNFVVIIIQVSSTTASRYDTQTIFDSSHPQHTQLEFERLGSLKKAIGEHKGAITNNSSEEVDTILRVYLPLLIN